MHHIGTQPFEAPRLLCRPFASTDWQDMFDLWISDPAVQSEYGEPAYVTPDAVKALLAEWLSKYQTPDFYRWAIMQITDTVERFRREGTLPHGEVCYCATK